MRLTLALVLVCAAALPAAAQSRRPNRLTFYCSAEGRLYPVAPAGPEFRALAGPLGGCRERKQVFVLAQEGTAVPTVPRERGDAIVADVDKAFDALKPEQSRDRGGLGEVQAELRTVKGAPLVVTAPAKVVEKATSGLKDTLKTQV